MGEYDSKKINKESVRRRNARRRTDFIAKKLTVIGHRTTRETYVRRSTVLNDSRRYIMPTPRGGF